MNQPTIKPDVGAVAVTSPQAIAVLPAEYAGLNARARAAADALSRPPISPILLTGFAQVGEFCLIAFTGFLVYLLYVVPSQGIDWWYSMPLLGGSALAIFAIQIIDGYSVPALRSPVPELGRILAAWTAIFAIFAVAAFLAKMGEQFSRVWFTSWYVAGLFAIILFRLALSLVVRRWTREGLLERRAVVVGGGQPAEDLIRALAAQPDNDVRICGIFDDRTDERSPPIVAGISKLGSVGELVDFGRIARVDLLIVSLPITAESRLLQLLKKLWVLPVDIRLSAHTNKLRFRPRTYSFVGKVPFLDVVDKPIADWDFVAKWLFDRILGAVLLVLTMPIMLLAALAIRLDSPGAVLFKQKRYGFNNELIEVYKFRSMYADKTDASATQLVTKGDARVTRVGRFIRRTSIDELPQLFNVVFKGNLSLVGPRPHAVHAKAVDRLYDEAVDGYFARHRVKPGITGWAQINGWRGETDSQEKIQARVEHDLYYIENWSVLLDLYILLMTPIRLLSSENAY